MFINTGQFLSIILVGLTILCSYSKFEYRISVCKSIVNFEYHNNSHRHRMIDNDE